jgi:hypothetical protein
VIIIENREDIRFSLKELTTEVLGEVSLSDLVLNTSDDSPNSASTMPCRGC